MFRSITGMTVALTVFLGSTGLSTQAWAASFAAKKDPRYIYAEDVKRAGGRYALDVPGAGKFQIARISSRVGKSGKCLVDRASLIQQIQRLGLRPPPSVQQAATEEIKMKASSGENGDVVCQGSGSGCTVFLPVWDPDDPVLPK